MHKDYLYVGIDVSLKTLVTCILDTSGTTILKPKTFANIPNGVDSLLATINIIKIYIFFTFYYTYT
ncbi:MAG: hypothetical protein ACLUD1_12570, partial [Clostridia bacterium]